MSEKHTISFADAELVGLAERTTKKGNKYMSGIILLRNDNGAYQSSHPFTCFGKAMGALRMLEQQEHSAELTGESGKPKRPVVNVSGWFWTNKSNWKTTFQLQSVDEIVDPAEDSSL